MKVYFADRELNYNDIKIEECFIPIDGKSGFRACQQQIDTIKSFEVNMSVITNVPFFISGEYGWNEATSSFDIFIECKSGKFVNIHELTNRELRKYHNLCKLYISGEFDEGIRNN